MEDLPTLAADIDAIRRLSGQFVLESSQVSSGVLRQVLVRGSTDAASPCRRGDGAVAAGDTAMVAGLELGGIPIATMVSSLTGLPTLFVRKQTKTYGTRRTAEGGEVAGKTVTLIEDVITTGGDVRDAAAALRGLGATVVVVVCAINRGSEKQPLDDVAIEVRPVLNRDDLDAAHERTGRR